MKYDFYFLRKLSCLILIFSALSEARSQDTILKSDIAFYSDFYVMQVRPMKFKISYSWPDTDRVSVRISDGNNNVIFTEQVLVYKKYQKLFDLSSFIDGQYTFELFDGEKRFKQSFDITTKTTRIAVASNTKALFINDL
ncbi:hypothetical protein [Dyadobacter sp. CY356]|uniref:hypothetical protein n=1 Tax=Dyadobacter sp. CY356 TaxID=2906442 RepID=UPI001F464D3A|nr:hypothetical protein [Dyadobacter sp. CY356]MCF0058971.1 hypothetical protein [Dyadobacter sp. CY356]